MLLLYMLILFCVSDSVSAPLKCIKVIKSSISSMFGAFQESRPAYGDERNLVLYLKAAPLNSSCFYCRALIIDYLQTEKTDKAARCIFQPLVVLRGLCTLWKKRSTPVFYVTAGIENQTALNFWFLSLCS